MPFSQTNSSLTYCLIHLQFDERNCQPIIQVAATPHILQRDRTSFYCRKLIISRQSLSAQFSNRCCVFLSEISMNYMILEVSVATMMM